MTQEEGFLSETHDVLIEREHPQHVSLTLATQIPVLNPGFEEQGSEGWNSLAAWKVTAQPENSAVRQDRTRFGGAHEGTFGLSLWSDQDFSNTVSQDVELSRAGEYVLRAATYSGMTGELTLQVRNSAGHVMSSYAVPNSDVYRTSEVAFSLSEPGRVSLEITSVGNAGDWAVIDSVELGLVHSYPTDGSDNPDPNTDDPDHDNPDNPQEPEDPSKPDSWGNSEKEEHLDESGKNKNADSVHKVNSRADNLRETQPARILASTGAGILTLLSIAMAAIVVGVVSLQLRRRKR